MPGALDDYELVPISREAGVSEQMVVLDLNGGSTIRCGVVACVNRRWCVRWMDGGTRFFDDIEQLKRNTAPMRKGRWPAAAKVAGGGAELIYTIHHGDKYSKGGPEWTVDAVAGPNVQLRSGNEVCEVSINQLIADWCLSEPSPDGKQLAVAAV